MPAQSVKVYAYWEPSKSMLMDLGRDHARDLDHFETAVCDSLTRDHGAVIGYGPRAITVPDPERTLGRFVHFWIPTALSRDHWHAALLEAAEADVVLIPQERWEFTEGPEDYEEWDKTHRPTR